MKVEDITIQCRQDDQTVHELVVLWEEAVRATHLFLTEEDIIVLRPVVSEGLRGIEKVFCVRDVCGIKAFMGIEGEKLEMLFVHPGSFKQGFGTVCVEYAIQSEGVCYVDVNEQNPRAVRFYEHSGFRCYCRSELDGQGRPFPVLHLSNLPPR